MRCSDWWTYSYKLFNATMSELKQNLSPEEKDIIVQQILLLKTKSTQSPWVVKQIQKLQQKL